MLSPIAAVNRISRLRQRVWDAIDKRLRRGVKDWRSEYEWRADVWRRFGQWAHQEMIVLAYRIEYA